MFKFYKNYKSNYITDVWACKIRMILSWGRDEMRWGEMKWRNIQSLRLLQKLTVSCRVTMKQESATLHKTHMTTQTNIATTEFTSFTNPLYIYLLDKCNLIRMGSWNDKTQIKMVQFCVWLDWVVSLALVRIRIMAFRVRFILNITLSKLKNLETY